MQKPNPDDRAVKTIVERVCMLASMPCNETLFNCNVADFRHQQIEKALHDAFGFSVTVRSTDTIYSITDKLKQVTQ